jgi:hypothetical protein
MCVRPMDNEVFEYVFGEEDGAMPSARAASPSDRSHLRRLRGVASTIAGILPDRFTIIVCVVICIAADIAIWRL